jgi:GT2 family glycosyltransferase
VSPARCDVVVPVYGAADAVRACVESLQAHLAGHLGEIHLEDDASDAAARAALEALAGPRVHVHSAPENTGFAASVNRGVARTRTPLVAVLNSDVVAHDDFLAPLVAALAADPKLAAVSPLDRPASELEGYEREHGVVRAYTVYGYAFVVRRDAFDAVGGFDEAFGRGYFEDVDLARRLLAAGWRLGLHPGSRVEHLQGASFQGVGGLSELRGANRERYHARWPDARRRVLLVTGAAAGLADEARGEVEAVLAAGGGVDWAHAGPPPRLPALPLRRHDLGVRTGPRLLRRSGPAARRGFTEVWIDAAAPRLRAAWVARVARARGLPVRRGGFAEART